MKLKLFKIFFLNLLIVKKIRTIKLSDIKILIKKKLKFLSHDGINFFGVSNIIYKFYIKIKSCPSKIRVNKFSY
jgi:hypothetical protein